MQVHFQTPTQRQCAVILVALVVVVAIALLYSSPRRSIPVNKPATGRPHTIPTQPANRVVTKQKQMTKVLEKKINEQEKRIETQGEKLAEQNSVMKTLLNKFKQLKEKFFASVQSPTSVNNIIAFDRLQSYAPSNLSAAGMTKATLRVQNSYTPIYVYSSKDLISQKILSTRRWENEQMTQTEKLLAADKTLNFLDFGCNLGVYTILAAKMGRQVVAVDANVENMKRLRRSLMDAKLESRVILLLNAIHRVHKSYKLRHYPNNIGGDHIYEVPEGTAGAVKSVTIDEIYHIIPFKKALLKLDIEGSEFDGLHNANILFTLMDIPIVFMEWGVINRDDKNGKVQAWIKNFFDKHGYSPCKQAFSNTTLGRNHASWPWDVVWKKKTLLK